MENKNFEKKQVMVNCADEEFNKALGYNTCLDRTNAKGIKDVLMECYLFLFDNRLNPELTNKIVTELKKAEQ